jgi:membrane protease YdiL (CAAX protease family)
MSSFEEHHRWPRDERPPLPLPEALPEVEPVLEALPVCDLTPLEEVSPLEEIVGADEVIEPLEYAEVIPSAPGVAAPYAVLVLDPPPRPLRPPRAIPIVGKGWTIAAWVVIGLVVCVEVYQNHFSGLVDQFIEAVKQLSGDGRTHGGAKRANQQGAMRPGEADPESEGVEEDAGFDANMFRFQGRYFLGWHDLLGAGSRSQFRDNIREMNAGPIEQRLRAIVLAGEMIGPDEALGELSRLPTLELDDVHSDVKDCLERLYRDFQRRRYNAPSLDADDRKLLIEELDWFGELALAPAGTSDTAAREKVLKPARTTALVLVGGVLGLGFLGVIGFCFLVILLIWLFAGWARRWLNARSPYGGIYGETIALWMLVFVLFGFFGKFMVDHIAGMGDTPAIVAADAADGEEATETTPPHRTLLQRSKLGILGLIELCTLVVLVYPCLRGIPWREVRQDVGLTWGRCPVGEPFLGLGLYAVSLPLFFIGLVVSLVLIAITGGGSGGGVGMLLADNGVKGHPIVPVLSRADTWETIQVFFLVSVVAPIIEETMFRGLMYRHLRDLTGKFGFGLSFLFSATLASFVFAIIHPQDLRSVPSLMSLAVGFTLAREWRGSLIPGMVMHGLHNGLLMLMLKTMLTL